MNAKTHKHYQSHPHVDTPYPVLEHSDTFASTSSTGSTGSFLDIKKLSHSVQKLPHIPNPVSATSHVIEDHIAEFKYGHASRAAKREARRSSQHSGSPWNHGAAHVRAMSIPESEESAEEWKERDQKAWEAELKKREAARKSTDSSRDWVGGWTANSEESNGGHA